jgi:hypothetical protein
MIFLAPVLASFFRQLFNIMRSTFRLWNCLLISVCVLVLCADFCSCLFQYFRRHWDVSFSVLVVSFLFFCWCCSYCPKENFRSLCSDWRSCLGELLSEFLFVFFSYHLLLMYFSNLFWYGFGIGSKQIGSRIIFLYHLVL